MKIDLTIIGNKRTQMQCKDCLKAGKIVGLFPFERKLHVYRKCATEGCENNFDQNNGKQWSEIERYEDFSSNELREILKWVNETLEIVHMFEGNKVVIGWDGDRPWKVCESDKKFGLSGKDFVPIREYASIRIRSILQEADSRVSKLSEASKPKI